MNASDSARTILLTAFEPSGDLLAARLIGELRRRDPSLRFVAFGGPKMQAAGAELIETTTEHAKMLLSAVGEVQNHRRRLKVLEAWLAENDIAALIPVDSPAANWSVCKRVRKQRGHAKIIHLVCPQIWGWATWRIHRLRRLTDRVLCMLPFEPDWLGERGVEGIFVGHPVFEENQDSEPPTTTGDDLPEPGEGGMRLAMMPGSRRGELERNWPTMQQVFTSLRQDHPGLVGVIAARTDDDAKCLEELIAQAGGMPEGLSLVAQRTDEVLAWSDLVFVKSGTSTLQVAAMRRPMVAFFNASRKVWLCLGKWLVAIDTFALPNLISCWQGDGRAVPEFIPHFGDPEPLRAALDVLLSDPEARVAQKRALARVCEPFGELHFGQAAAAAVMELLD